MGHWDFGRQPGFACKVVLPVPAEFFDWLSGPRSPPYVENGFSPSDVRGRYNSGKAVMLPSCMMNKNQQAVECTSAARSAELYRWAACHEKLTKRNEPYSNPVVAVYEVGCRLVAEKSRVYRIEATGGGGSFNSQRLLTCHKRRRTIGRLVLLASIPSTSESHQFSIPPPMLRRHSQPNLIFYRG